jgi:putative Holliday junction resolvase
LGVDVGSAKIGVARGSAMARIAQPLKTLSANSAIDELAALASQSGAEGIVVGLPRSLDGNETAQTSYVRNWAKLAHTMSTPPRLPSSCRTFLTRQNQTG